MFDGHLDPTDDAAARRGGDPVAALALALDTWRQADDQGDAATAAGASIAVAWSSLQVGEVEAGLTHATAAARFYAETGMVRHEIVARAIHAWLLLEMGLTEAAVEEALRVVAKAEDCGGARAESWATNVLAVVYWACKQLDRAEALSLRAVALARNLGDRQLLGWWLINLAGIRAEAGYRLRALEDEAAALAAFAEALALNDEAIVALTRPDVEPWGAQIALCNAAEYHIATGALAAADALLARWDRVPPATGPRTLAQYLYTRSSLLIRQGRAAEALPFCDRALALARDTRNTDSEAHALRTLSEIHEKLGRLDLALATYKRFHAVQSTLAAAQVQRRARIAEIHYETDRLKALALQATRRADDLARTQRLDPLTGLGNRRLLDETLASFGTRLQPFSIAVLDLDHFKSVNDRFSHAVGDEVLRRFAAIIRSCVRLDDIATRMGGEEFVLILPAAEGDVATSLCRRVMAGLAEADWSDLNPALRVTASIGVAASREALEPKAVMALADARLYIAKAAGRDRLVASSPPARRRPSARGAVASPIDDRTAEKMRSKPASKTTGRVAVAP